MAHLDAAVESDYKNFYKDFYVPNNAYLVVAGDVTLAQVKRLAKKWFEPIPRGEVVVKNLPKEPRQTQARFLEVEADVPVRTKDWSSRRLKRWFCWLGLKIKNFFINRE
jgi:predicted Zn-dependent peptidase